MARGALDGVMSMSGAIILEQPLSWRQVAAVAEGAPLALSERAAQRIGAARLLVESIVAKGIRAYGINTGVGALCDVVVDASQLRHLSRNIVMSHAVGMGPALGHCEVRAMIAAAISNFAHGRSGIRLAVVERLEWLLQHGWTPEVPAAGSVGYLSHMAHIALTVLGDSHVQRGAERCATADVLRASNLEPLVLEAKEGLSLVNGTPCVTGLMCLALLRAERLLNWADVVAAMTFENLHGQLDCFDPDALALRASAAVCDVGERLRSILQGSALIAGSVGRRTQDPLSLRAIPHVHGAAREVFARTAALVDAELAAVTDNPAVMGTEEEPRALSQANALGAAIGLAADSLAVAMAELVAMSERRIDRLVNPLVSGLPAFLASDSGAGSGLMIAQYAAVALVAENRRLAAPASLDGGVTSGLQEDHLCHATPAALKLLKVLDNAEYILAIELLAAAQAYDLQGGAPARAPNTDIVYHAVRARIPHYRDDRPLHRDIERVRNIIRGPTAVDFETDGDADFDADAEADADHDDVRLADPPRRRAPRRRSKSGARKAVLPS
jgi:histidine ammonia-lyase